MQDCYAGDVGDFGKYALLNRLCAGDGNGGPALSLGVLWYCFTEDEPREHNDGKHIGYLQHSKCREFRQCDPCLWEKMRKVVFCGRRSIATVEASGALPAGTAYYSEPLALKRCAWLKDGRGTVASAELVFFDPDNGFEPKGVKPHYKKGPKYVYYGDLDAHIDAGQSLVSTTILACTSRTTLKSEIGCTPCANALTAGGTLLHCATGEALAGRISFYPTRGTPNCSLTGRKH